MKKLCRIICLLFPVALQMPFISAQNAPTIPVIVPPSPNAASLGMYGNIPVGHYTGIPRINIPLYEIISGNIHLPVGLSYHASGIKVAQESSWVGLGWTLNAGGVITRSVRGWDDFGWVPEGYARTGVLPRNDVNNNPLGTEADYLKYYNNVSDPEPDLFYYNFGNYSGKMIFPKHANHPYVFRPVLANQEPLDVKYLHNNDGGCWEIRTPDGCTWYFGTKEATTLTERELQPTVTTSWYLDSIVSPERNKIAFTYGKQANTMSQLYLSRQASNLVDGSGHPGGPLLEYDYEDITQYTIREKYLTKIEFNNGTIEFTTKDRNDIIKKTIGTGDPEPQCLDGMIVRNNGSRIVRYFRFGTSYFNGTSGTDTKKLRLRLDALTEDLSGAKYSFFYNTQTLPDKDSHSIDHWGYYNGAGDDQELIPHINIRFVSINREFPGGNREPNDKALTGMLTQITYPTGGYTKFKYGVNEYPDEFYTDKKGAGARIEKITDFDGKDSSCVYYDYNYKNLWSSGQLMSHPHYWYLIYAGHSNSYYQYVGIYAIRISESMVPLGASAQGNYVGYSQVTEIRESEAQNGKTIHYFKNTPESADNEPIPGVPCRIANNNGLLNKKEFLNAQGHPIRTEVMNYEMMESTQLVIKGLRIFPFRKSTNSFTVKYYDNISEWSYLLKKTTTTSEPGNTPVIETEEYEYGNTQHKLITKQTTRTSDGGTLMETFKYPQDVTYTSGTKPEKARQKLIENGNIHALLEQSQSKNGKTLASVTEYDIFPNNTAAWPSIIKTNSGSNQTSENRIRYHSYDSRGNPTCVSYENGQAIVYVWSYKGQYPVAEIRSNTDSGTNYYATIIGLISLADRNKLATDNPSDADIHRIFSALRNRTEMKEALITSYTYIPLVGVTSETDPSGRTVFYEYDNAGRLIRVKDQDGNILKDYEYNYKN